MNDRSRQIESEVLSCLEDLGVGYDVVPCDPDLADTAAFCEHYGFPPETSANTIVVASRTEPRQYVACVVAATTRIDVNGCVRRRLGVRKASFAPAEETAELTGMMIGGVTPVGLPDGIPVWVDARVMDLPEIVLGGGSRSMKIRTTPELLRRLPSVEVVEGLAVDAG